MMATRRRQCEFCTHDRPVHAIWIKGKPRLICEHCEKVMKKDENDRMDRGGEKR